jgi:hypothetical protein
MIHTNDAKAVSSVALSIATFILRESLAGRFCCRRLTG